MIFFKKYIAFIALTSALLPAGGGWAETPTPGGLFNLSLGDLMNIEVTSDEENVTLVYRDNGVGVEREFQKVIYDPFVTTKRGSGSTGLGMQVVYNIITQALGGTISLKSEVNAGIEFTIVFPRDLRSLNSQ